MRTSFALASITLALCFGCGGDDGDKGAIKIGLLAPKTGALMAVGSSFERVAIVSVADINAKGGVDGRDLELVVVDTETNAMSAGQKLQAMIDQGVIAVVGPATSGEVGNAWPVAAANKVPIMSPSSTAPALSRPAPSGPADDGFMFRNVPDDEIQSLAMAYYLRSVRNPVVPNVVVLYEDSPYGNGLKDAFRLAFEALGGATVDASHQVSFSQNLASEAAARTIINQLAAVSPSPTMVVMIALEQDAVKLVNAWYNGGTPVIANMQWFMTDGARSGGFLTGGGASVRGMCGTAPTYPLTGTAYAALQTAYDAAYDDLIGDQVYAPNVWDGFHLMAAAMVSQANSHSGEPLGGDHLRDAITTVSKDGQTFNSTEWRTMISALRSGNDVDFDGASGPNNIDVVGQTVGPYEVWCVSGTGDLAFNRALFLEADDIEALRNP